jgi:hypothetical protein
MIRPSRRDLKEAALSLGDLTDAEWRILNPFSPIGANAVPPLRTGGERSTAFLGSAHRSALARYARSDTTPDVPSSGPRGTSFVKRFRSQMSITAEHFPIFMASDERLFNRKSGFEEAACAFVPEVVKAQVVDVKIAALAPECRTHRPPIAGGRFDHCYCQHKSVALR